MSLYVGNVEINAVYHVNVFGSIFWLHIIQIPIAPSIIKFKNLKQFKIVLQFIYSKDVINISSLCFPNILFFRFLFMKFYEFNFFIFYFGLFLHSIS